MTKRFNYTSEKIGQHWCIEISDNQTKQPFDVSYSEITDNYSQTRDNVKFIVELLNELNDKYIDEYALRETLQQDLQRVEEENKELKGKLEVYRELYPSGKWICDLNSDELKKELEE